MFGAAGVAYVYFVYGMHHMFNIVCGPEGFPAAVLVRGVKIEGIDSKMTDGPAKLCNVLKIDKSLNKEDLTVSNKIWVEGSGSVLSSKNIISTKRVGVEYAGSSADLLWRFIQK